MAEVPTSETDADLLDQATWAGLTRRAADNGDLHLLFKELEKHIASSEDPTLRARLRLNFIVAGDGILPLQRIVDHAELGISELSGAVGLDHILLPLTANAATNNFRMGQARRGTELATEAVLMVNGGTIAESQVGIAATTLSALFLELSAFEDSVELAQMAFWSKHLPASAWPNAAFNLAQSLLVGRRYLVSAGRPDRPEWLSLAGKVGLKLFNRGATAFQRELLGGGVLADVRLEQGDVFAARHYIDRAKAELGQNDLVLAGWCHQLEGRVLRAEGRLSEALPMFDQACCELQNAERDSLVIPAMEGRMEILVGLDRFEEALEASAQLNRLLLRRQHAYLGQLANAVLDRVELETIKGELVGRTEELTKETEVDVLTGVASRRRLEAEMVHRTNSDSMGSVLLIDLDDFKAINDCYLHASGDMVLQKIGETLASITRNEDLTARYGGEEFVVLSSLGDPEDVARLAERFRVAISDLTFAPPLHELRVSASIGFAVGPQTSTQKMFGIADQRLYEAKKRGKNCVVGPAEFVL